MRWCPGCDDEKPATERHFYRKPSKVYRSGWSRLCKECHREEAKKVRKAARSRAPARVRMQSRVRMKRHRRRMKELTPAPDSVYVRLGLQEVLDRTTVENPDAMILMWARAIETARKLEKETDDG